MLDAQPVDREDIKTTEFRYFCKRRETKYALENWLLVVSVILRQSELRFWMKSLRCFISSVGGGAASCDVVLTTSIRIGKYEIDKSNGNVRNERFGEC